MTHKRLIIWSTLFVTLFFAACAPFAVEQPTPMPATAAAPATLSAQPTTGEAPASPLRQPVAPVAQQSPLRPQIPPMPSGVTGEAPQTLLDTILDDVVQQTGLDRSELIVVQDQAVVWPDGSLGCPQPGMMYTMALVDGYHVIVQAGDELIDYRVGNNNTFQRCP